MLNRLIGCHNIADVRSLAQRRLPAPVFHYIDGAADDELTARRNVDSFSRYALTPRCLVNVERVDTSTKILGCEVRWPILCAPTGMSRLFHHEGELAVARAAAASGTLYTLSTMSSVSIEDVASVCSGPKAFQIYVFRDRGLNTELIDRCREAKYDALCLTVDVAVLGNRERDLRTGMTIPPRFGLRSLMDFATHPYWVWNFITKPALTLANVVNKAGPQSDDITTLSRYIHSQFDPSVDWDDAARMIERWGGPFAVKGVLSASDARRAVDCGATAIIVSNHGGRQLDGLCASLDALAEIVDAVGDRAEIILDGGIRRGTHVLIALAMGADACMIGRPYLYGLGAAGEKGVAHVLGILQEEIERGMALLGCQTVKDLHTFSTTRICMGN